MKLRIILPILIFISLAYAVLLPSSWNFCLPDGCVFNTINECNMSPCLNENINTHLNERSVFLNAIINDTNYLSSLFVVVFLYALSRVLTEYFNIAQLIKSKLYKHHNTIINNFFVVLFSKGVLHPKIY